MAYVTITIVLNVNPGVSTPYDLLLESATLISGQWGPNPPSTIYPPSTPPKVYMFVADQRTLKGPEGTVVYKSTDSNSNPTLITIYFDDPIWSRGNIITLTGGSENYTLALSDYDKNGYYPSATATITQIGPVDPKE